MTPSEIIESMKAGLILVGRETLQLALPRLLSDGRPLSFADRDADANLSGHETDQPENGIRRR
jgi:hypothetical protein